MAWHSAHVILWVRFKDGVQGHYPAWETVFLVDAAGVDAAKTRAEELGRREEGGLRGIAPLGGTSRDVRYAGVRKVTPVSHVQPGGTLGDGDELAFSEYRLADRESLAKLAEGGSAPLEYVE